MDIDNLRNLVDARKVNHEAILFQWEISLSKTLNSIKIETSRQIKINELKICGVDKSLIKISGSEGVSGNPDILLENKVYFSKWSNKSDYFIKIEFTQKTFVNKIIIKTPNPFNGKINDYSHGKWIFESTIIPSNENENLPVVIYDDGVDWDTNNKITNEIKELFKNASSRKKPNETFSIYKKIKKSFDKNTFFEIDKLLRMVLWPDTLNSHGYYKSLINVNKNNLINDLEQSISWFEDNRYNIFMASGTLLGAVRAGDFIDHDDDLDFGIFIEGENINEVIKSMQKIEIHMKNTYELIFSIFRGDKLQKHWKIRTNSGFYFDLFPAWAFGGILYAHPYCNGKLKFSDLFPLSKISIHQGKLPAPNDTEKFLELNYGPNWKEPDPTWEFDWDNNKIDEYDDAIKIARMT